MSEYAIRVTVPVNTEPITKDDVKKHLRLDISDISEDGQIDGWIKAARERAEEVTRIALAPQTLELALNHFPCTPYIDLMRWPVNNITSFKYYGSDGTEYTLVQNTDFKANIDYKKTGKVELPYGKYWPAVTLDTVNPIKIIFTAGTHTNLSEGLKKSMLIHIGLFYKYRDEPIPKEVKEAQDRDYMYHKIAGWF